MDASFGSSCALATCALLCVLAPIEQAFACACCADQGARIVAVEKLDLARREKIDQLRFGQTAELFVSDAGIESIKGIVDPAERYSMEVARDRDSLIFSFRDKGRRAGTLNLHVPAAMSRFEVDPRDGQREQGGGVRLYKEWKLSSKMAGTGIFKNGNGNGQFITLILQGHGNFCSDFTQWTLVINGPTANYSFFGDLIPRN